ncbi:MAG: carbamoyltransferase HypF [Chloroflexi bacterium]|nr:carbamoyltransferase HypF [Chloroflexota bacterium]
MTIAENARLKVVIHGAVQGVGFRPFVYRLATEMGLRGWVLNSSQGVFIEVEGERAVLEAFLLRLEQEKPPLAIIQSLEFSFLDPIGYPDFVIRHSEETGEKTVLVLPDIATCPHCYREVGDPGDRRYRYPFTNCTHCGPRFTIIRALPYDRPNTSMAHFPLCPDCRREYEHPLDRRFHAQPVACPVCGPQVVLSSGDGHFGSARHLTGQEAIQEAARAVREGRILAMKGLGGFLLIVDARNEAAVQRLRGRKQREEKPFALLYPSLEVIKEHCMVSPLEERVLTSPESPIVLLRRRRDHPPLSPPPGRGGMAGGQVCQAVAPGNPYLGVMLPYTPLHDLLMQELGFPVVATSGNRSDEPICIDEDEARERLGGIADLFLIHNRPIVRHCDDSIVRVVLGQELVLRRARGYAPLPVRLPKSGRLRKSEPPPILAVGAHLKNAIALSVGRQVFVSQHIGDLDTPQACAAFQRVIADFLRLYEVQPVAIAHDLHPDYFSTRWARKVADGHVGASLADALSGQGQALPLRIPVQHHHAHLASCLAENEVEGPALGVTWDGTGYGLDGTVWGGEFLWGDASGFERVAHLRTFRLPGGEAAVREPRRSALGVLWEHCGPQALEWDDLAPVAAFSHSERRLLRQMLERGVNAPLTSSAGRLFDAVAALVDLRQENRFEGQAAMMLEYAVDETVEEAYPLPVTQYPIPNLKRQTSNVKSKIGNRKSESLVLDWGPLLEALLADLRRGVPVGVMAARFHNALVEGMVAVARAVGVERAALSGGCFQNRILMERAYRRLTEAGLRVYVHQRIPPNDGGIALGQVAVAAEGVR